MTNQELKNIKRHLEKLVAQKHRTASQPMRETLSAEIAFYKKAIHDELKLKRKQTSGGQ